jgi:branched-chain amino acid transport system substrate-binding protein
MESLAGFCDRLVLLRLLCLGLQAVLLPACREEPAPVKIGYVGGLTGRVAGLGVAGRDGVLLAVEACNQAGGIEGRRVEVVTRDDRQDAEAGRAAVNELIAAEVAAIVGPMTSAMAEAMQPVANRAGVALISPTVTANRFSGQDDYFFRMTMPLGVNAGKLAEHVLRQGLGTVAVGVDTANAAYTEDWLTSFRGPFEAGGGRIVHVERFRSGAEGGFLPLAERLLKQKPAAVLLLSGAMDTALIAQQVRKLGSRVPLFASEWANTSDVISFGGKAVEEMCSFVTYNPASDAERHRRFLADFERRFGYRPSFAAVLAYEAAEYLLAGLKRNPRREGLKHTLLEIGGFTGLQGEVRIDRFGDAERKTYLAVIRQGRFATID